MSKELSAKEIDKVKTDLLKLFNNPNPDTWTELDIDLVLLTEALESNSQILGEVVDKFEDAEVLIENLALGLDYLRQIQSKHEFESKELNDFLEQKELETKEKKLKELEFQSNISDTNFESVFDQSDIEYQEQSFSTDSQQSDNSNFDFLQRDIQEPSQEIINDFTKDWELPTPSADKKNFVYAKKGRFEQDNDFLSDADDKDYLHSRQLNEMKDLNYEPVKTNPHLTTRERIIQSLKEEGELLSADPKKETEKITQVVRPKSIFQTNDVQAIKESLIKEHLNKRIEANTQNETPHDEDKQLILGRTINCVFNNRNSELESSVNKRYEADMRTVEERIQDSHGKLETLSKEPIKVQVKLKRASRKIDLSKDIPKSEKRFEPVSFNVSRDVTKESGWVFKKVK